MKVRKLFLSLALAPVLSALAGNPVTVVFHTHDGATIGYSLADKPVCKYVESNTKLQVSTPKTEVEYEVANLRKFVFSDEVVGISAPALSDAKVSQGENVLSFSGFPKGTRAAVYAADGSIVATATADASGNAQISLASAAKGVYIAKAGKQSVKIIKR